MEFNLTPRQKEDRAAFRAFTDENIMPHADKFDREEWMPPETIQLLARQGYLGALISYPYGGHSMDMITFGHLNEEIGRGCSSLRSLITVHSMVSFAIERWGSQQQKEKWLPKLATGELLAAFALSEPHIGSDAKSIETTATPSEAGYLLTGQKKWITYGQIAHLFLVFAQYQGKLTAFLVERDSPGLSFTPIRGLLGTRASLLAEIKLNGCWIPKDNLLGGVGFGFHTVALSALDIGRYSVAWGCVGIGQACIEACLHYANERQQFGALLKEHQLICRMISDMVTATKAARLMCYQAGYARECGDTSAGTHILMAKYFASTQLAQTVSDSVQLHGANGCSADYPVQRYYRDAKVMEIIEGSTQIQQITIAKNAYRLPLDQIR